MKRATGLLLLLAFLYAAGHADANEPTVSQLRNAIRFDPHSESSSKAMNELARRGEAGWKVLRNLLYEFESRQPRAARLVAWVLSGGVEPERVQILEDAYEKLAAPELRGLIARGLALSYPGHAELLHEHVRSGGAYCEDILSRLDERGLTNDVALSLLTGPRAKAVYHVLRGRKVKASVEQLLPVAHVLASSGNDPARALAYVNEFAADADLDLMRAIARLLRSDDVTTARGAHCLLLTLSGIRLGPDAEQWQSWIDGRSGYTKPTPTSPGAIEAAIVRARAYLHRDLAPDGISVWRRGSAEVGSTALVVLALRAAGVPADDPAIEKAIRTRLLVFGRGDRPGLPQLKGSETYCLSLLAMALQAVDSKRFTEPLIAIRDRLAGGQLANGQWTYDCARGTGAKRPAEGDNSNTQYAILGLRAILHAGLEIDAGVWKRCEAWWRTTTHERGGWHYSKTRMAWKRKLSMTSAGIGALAMCLEGIHGKQAASVIREDATLNRALQYLGELLLVHEYDGQELYTYYGVERAGVLMDVKDFKSLHRAMDWYQEGARRLLHAQHKTGAWGHPRARSDVQGSGYGFVVDTAYGLLFLCKATQTLGPQRNRTIVVEIKDEKPPKEAKPEPQQQKPAPAKASQPPKPIVFEEQTLYTSKNSVIVRGRVTNPAARVRVGEVVVQPDAAGHFEVSLDVEGSGDVPVQVLAHGGATHETVVKVVLDTTPPKLELLGPSVRAVGRQPLRVRASEPLSGLRIGQRFAPASGRIAEIPMELQEGKQQRVTVFAVDRAGNAARHVFVFEALNRVLVLDGKSALRVTLKENPAVFTLECWVRGEPPSKTMCVAANTEAAGFGLFWHSRACRLPSGYVRSGSKYLIPMAKKPWKWKRWTHLALTYDGDWARFFVNGKLQGEQQGGDHHPSRYPLFVGAEAAGRGADNYFVGAIDEVRLSRTVRYTDTFKPDRYFGRDPDTVLLLHFDTDQDHAFFDDSPLSHASTPVGTPRIEQEKR